jgi:hypothetical protein
VNASVKSDELTGLKIGWLLGRSDHLDFRKADAIDDLVRF